MEAPIVVDTSSWTRADLDDGSVAFDRPSGDRLMIYGFDVPPDLPSLDVQELRRFYRGVITEAGGGLVTVDVIDVDGVPSVLTLFKFPQQPTGMTYVGAVTVPFRDRSFVVRVQSFELGTTGLRESTVVMLEPTSPDGFPEGWAADPYDPTHQAAVLANKADDERWDATFPEHPLSRLRRILGEIVSTTRLSSEVRASPAFR